ncbi:MAG TPA: RNA methyltransferase [Bellilinea sp.]|nr:RNA methyltransferase [Bellilinea sp.]
MPYFEIGVCYPRNKENIGTLWRSAYQLGAAGVFTIGRTYKHQSSDVLFTENEIPLRHYDDFEHFLANRPKGAQLIAVEMGGTPLREYKHPSRAIYLLGSEAMGLSDQILSQCNAVISLESVRYGSYNLAVAGSIVMYHRLFGLTSV